MAQQIKKGVSEQVWQLDLDPQSSHGKKKTAPLVSS